MKKNLIINRKSKRDVQWRYILNCIKIANTNTLFISHADMMNHIIDEFRDNDERPYAVIYERIAWWLYSCPTCIEIDHDPKTIAKIGKAWGYCKTERSTENFVNGWYLLLARRIVQMCEFLNVQLF